MPRKVFIKPNAILARLTLPHYEPHFCLEFRGHYFYTIAPANSSSDTLPEEK